GTVVAYKGGRRLAELRDRVAAAGALERAWCAEHLGTPDEKVVPLAEVDAASYLSTVLVLPVRRGRGQQL
ncbi:MAG: precorrin-2 C(20)-methyltransferase, partial [Actinomycetota bacterium]|nr:precorrin-2 C(20)-methyltransferase [Actinomycetota bacterium]